MSTTDIIAKVEGVDERTKAKKRTVKAIKKFPNQLVQTFHI